MLRHTVGIRAETPGSGLTREGLLLFKANFHAGIHTGNNLSADIRATAWESSHPQLLTIGGVGERGTDIECLGTRHGLNMVHTSCLGLSQLHFMCQHGSAMLPSCLVKH